MTAFRRTAHPSPNWGPRPRGVDVSAIILHADAAARVEESLDWITRRESQVSYHIVVSRSAWVFDIVDPAHRAWHAGVSSFAGRANCNDYSVGVCLANRNDGEVYPEIQLAAAAVVCAELMLRFPRIAFDRITTHALVALPPGRKTDPAPPFDLAAFRTRVQLAFVARAPSPPPRPA